MKHKSIHRLGAVVTLTTLLMFAGASKLCPMELGEPPEDSPIAPRSLNRLPLYFIENTGTLDPQVDFYVRGRDKSVYFESEGLTYSLSGRGPSAGETWAVKVHFEGARSANPVGVGAPRGTVSFFSESGNPSRTFRAIRYRELWPGVDLSYLGDRGELKYEFSVSPGADPGQIRLSYHGASLALDSKGRLEVSTPLGVFYDDQPLVYQQALGERAQVEAAYEVDPETGIVSFAIGDYDPNRELIIDPAVILRAGFFGGAGDDEANDIAVDGAGNTYIVGTTTSSAATFPVTAGPGRTYSGGGVCALGLPCGDAFVAKLDPEGELVYLGYIGGNGVDTGAAIAVDSDGAAYITGTTSSRETSFPVRSGPDLTFNRGGRTLIPTDAFVAKVDPTGTSLVYAGYIGGVEGDQGADIAVDSAGNAYVVGNANSPETSFPTLVGPDLTHNSFTPNNQSTDAFIAKVSPAGQLVYSGFIGGLSGDVGHGVAVDAEGAAYVTGTTYSREDSFPVRIGPDLTHNDPNSAVNGDAFVAKVSPDGSRLVYAGFVGGASTDFGGKIAVDSRGAAYLYGVTASNESSFPVATGPDTSFNSGAACPSSPFNAPCTDVFVAKVVPSGGGLIYAGYIGGAADESSAQVPFPQGDIAVDSTGAAYVTAPTQSNEESFPVVGGPGLTFNESVCGSFPFVRPCSEAFVAKVSADGARLAYAGYLGGTRHDRVGGIAVDPSGTAYVAGGTTSAPAELTAPAQSANGGFDVFVVAIASQDAGLSVLNAASFEAGSIAPGQIVSLFGEGIGPDQALEAQLDASGRIATTLGGVEVRFDGAPAPLLYAASGQINAQVPYEVQGRTRIEVLRDGVSEAETTVAVAPTSPGLFTASEGQALAVHPDGSFVSPANPVTPGEIVTFYATGEGALAPMMTAGELAGEPLGRPIAQVSLTIDGRQADILYAGAAPGYAGLMQINARAPLGVSPGEAPVQLEVGGASSQSGLSVAVGR